MELIHGNFAFFSGYADRHHLFCEYKRQELQAALGDPLFGMEGGKTRASDAVALPVTIRTNCFNLLVPERYIPWLCALVFRFVYVRAQKRVQRVALVGIRPQQQRHDWADFNVVRSLRHHHTLRHYVRKRSHESFWPGLRGVELLLERVGQNQRGRCGLVGLQLWRICWSRPLDLCFCSARISPRLI